MQSNIKFKLYYVIQFDFCPSKIVSLFICNSYHCSMASQYKTMACHLDCEARRWGPYRQENDPWLYLLPTNSSQMVLVWTQQPTGRLQVHRCGTSVKWVPIDSNRTTARVWTANNLNWKHVPSTAFVNDVSDHQNGKVVTHRVVTGVEAVISVPVLQCWESGHENSFGVTHTSNTYLLYTWMFCFAIGARRILHNRHYISSPW